MSFDNIIKYWRINECLYKAIARLLPPHENGVDQAFIDACLEMEDALNRLKSDDAIAEDAKRWVQTIDELWRGGGLRDASMFDARQQQRLALAFLRLFVYVNTEMHAAAGAA